MFNCQTEKQNKIRSARQADIPEILRIQTQCRLGVWSEADYLREISNNEAVFAVAENLERSAIGFVLARFADGCAELDLLNIGVAPKFRKRGVGELLLRELINEACRRRTRAIWLEVRESNAAAISFYLKNGFVVVQRRKNFYAQPNEDALLMSLDLKLFGKT